MNQTPSDTKQPDLELPATEQPALKGRPDPGEHTTQPTNGDPPRTVTGRLYRVRSGHGWQLTSEPPPPEPGPVRRPARVARMLALAHHLERAIQAGRVADRAALARELGVTRARISQLLDLLLLAPDIQEALLFAEAIDGREPISMRALRPLALVATWPRQRRTWRELLETRRLADLR